MCFGRFLCGKVLGGLFLVKSVGDLGCCFPSLAPLQVVTLSHHKVP